MPTKKSSRKKNTSKTTIDGVTSSFDMLEKQTTTSKAQSKTPYIIVGLALILLAAIAVMRGWVVAAVVNGKPIFQWELTQSLMNRYGKQTLESIISEQIIYGEGKKAGVIITQKDIDAKEEEILKSFGGKVTLDDVLKYQGMTKSDFDNQVKVQLLVYKLLGKDIQISDDEIKTYIETNKDMLVATTEAEMSTEAKTAILDQKINEKIQPWFNEIKDKAKVFRFNQ